MPAAWKRIAQDSPETAVKSCAALAHRHPMNIVMLDDERISLALLRNHVSKLEGTRGFAFTHPSDALRWCAANRVDAVIVDFMMHEMDGLEFVARLRNDPRNRDVPILMVTGSTDADLRRRAHSAGVATFLTKPVDVAALRDRLREVIARRSHHASVGASSEIGWAA